MTRRSWTFPVAVACGIAATEFAAGLMHDDASQSGVYLALYMPLIVVAVLLVKRRKGRVV